MQIRITAYFRRRQCHWYERYAIHRARVQAQLAAGALTIDNGVHTLRSPEYGVDRTRMNAQRATDTCRLIDTGHDPWSFFPTGRVEGPRFAIECCREGSNGRHATRRATIQIDQSSRQRFGVLTTAWISALRALSLRQ